MRKHGLQAQRLVLFRREYLQRQRVVLVERQVVLSMLAARTIRQMRAHKERTSGIVKTMAKLERRRN